MQVHEAILSGASIGLTIAAPVGPMAVIVIRRTLSGGFLVGVASGAGASTVHLAYATLAVVGLDRITRQTHDHQAFMTGITALVLLFFAARMLLRPHALAGKAVGGRKSLLGHYTSAVAFNSLNPMGFALILGAVTAVSGLATQDWTRTCALAGGVFVGSIAWWLCLVAVTATLGVRLSPKAIQAINVVAGLVLLGLALSTASKIF